MVAVVAILEATRIPSSSPLAPLRASSVTSLVAAVAPVWSLTAVTFRATGPLSGVKNGIPVKGRAAVSADCPGNITDNGVGGLADGDVVGDGYGIADGGDVRIALAGGGRGGGWDCPSAEAALGATRTPLVASLALW